MKPDKTLEKGGRLLLEVLYPVVDNAVGMQQGAFGVKTGGQKLI